MGCTLFLSQIVKLYDVTQGGVFPPKIDYQLKIAVGVDQQIIAMSFDGVKRIEPQRQSLQDAYSAPGK